MAEYLWEQADEDELTRLRSLEALYDVHTFDVLDRLGVGEGWTCAEVGAGAGSVTDWLCRRVRPTGRVVAVDITTTFVERLDHRNLEVRRADVVEHPLEEGVYDLIHARTLLEHLPARDEVVAAFAAALRPGGVLVAEDVVLTGTTAVHPPSELIERLNDAFAKGFAMSGADLDFGIRLPDTLRAAGLTGVDADGHVPIVTSGTPSADFQTHGLRRQGSLLVEAGLLSDEDVAAGIEAASSPGHTMFAPIMIAAWGRHP
jgi:SAM-dependent methyltransferase